MRSISSSRALELLALAAIGEGVIALCMPTEHARVWSGGPRWWRDLMRTCERNPGFTRGVGIAEIGAGLWLARSALKH